MLLDYSQNKESNEENTSEHIKQKRRTLNLAFVPYFACDDAAVAALVDDSGRVGLHENRPQLRRCSRSKPEPGSELLIQVTNDAAINSDDF